MKAKLIYIVSAGHSGSTLLDLVVGTIPGVFSTGELTYLPWQISRGEISGPNASKQKLCSCQKGFKECSTWVKIIRCLSEIKGYDIYKFPYKFKINLMGNVKYFSKRFSFGWALRNFFSFAVDTRIKFIVSFYRMGLKKAINNNWLLFDTIATTNNVQFVVDSSKNVDRLNLLSTSRPKDIYVLLLKRDIKAVTYSGVKLGQDPIKTAKGWVRQYNHIYRSLEQMEGVKIFPVLYEKLASNPDEVREEMSKFLGCQSLDGELHINTHNHHLVAGNGMRHKGVVSVRFDDQWQTSMPTSVVKDIASIESNALPEPLVPFQ